MDTTSRHSNLPLIEMISDWFTAHHLPVRLTHDDTGKKANLFATLPAHDGSVRGGVLLSGHTDVVPVDGQQWETNPFVATQIDDRIYGRGTCDMKGFVAVLLASLPELQSQSLAKPIHFAFSYDEEVGCVGVSRLISDMIQVGIQPDACIVGEPTLMRPVIAHKGIHLYRCRFEGKAAHSSLTPNGCNAIDYAAQFVCWLKELALELQREGRRDSDFDVPFTSLSTNMMQGGTAVNIVPSSCDVLFDIRNLPTEQASDLFAKIKQYLDEHLLREMKSEHPDAAITLETLVDSPALNMPKDAAISRLVQEMMDHASVYKVAYATEAGLFQQAGIPTIVCGPGSIEQAHKPNEFVTLEQLNQCEAFIRGLPAYLNRV